MATRTFVVDRKKWYRGKGGIESQLLREDGTRCCIGFVGQQCGIKDSELRGLPDVQATVDEGTFDKWPRWMTDEVGSDINRAYHINDDKGITDAERESQLQAIFKRHRQRIVFEG